MKKYKITAVLLAAVFTVFAIVACACVDKPKAQELTELTLPTMGGNQMAVIIKNGEKDYTNIVVTLGAGGVDAKNVEDVLSYLADTGTISLDWSDSEYGKQLNAIGKLTPDASKNEFVTYLTSVESDFGTWAGVTTYTVGGVKLVSSGLGISSMTVQAGAVVLFEIAMY